MNMTVYKTRYKLDYGQGAYLIRLDKSEHGYDYLCIDTYNDYDDYKIGEVVKDIPNNEVEPSTYDIKKCPIYNTFLFQHFLEKKPNRNVRDILPYMVKVSNNSILTQELANELAKEVSLKTYKDLQLWLKIVERKIQEKERAFRSNFYR